MNTSRFIIATAMFASLAAAAQLTKPPIPSPPLPPDPLHLTAQFMKLDPPRLPTLSAQVRAPEIDLPIALWIASRAHVTPEVVIQAHIGGLDWLNVFTKFRVPVETIIVPVQSKCPPYGNAWGYRRKHGGAPAVRFTEAELAEFVHVRAINGIYGTPFTEIVTNRCAGRGMGEIIGDEHEKKHGKGKDKEWKEEKKDHGHGNDDHGNGDHGNDDHGKGKGGKGHGKGHGGK